jgi:imidazolonepropionase-like amidohydrolase
MIARARCRVVALLAALAVHAAFAQDFVVTNVRVFDGRDVVPATRVVVAGGVIRAVGDEAAVAKDVHAIDGTGLTLVPGLIDAHVHVRNVGELRQALRFGVTTVLDMATVAVTPQQMTELRAIANASSDMADMRSAGYPATSPGGHMTEFGVFIPTVMKATNVAEFVSMRREEGSDYLKIVLNGAREDASRVTNLDESSVKALVEAAHAKGMLAVAHVETLEDVSIALAAGMDGLMHVWRRGGADAEVAHRLAQRNVFVVPTLAVPDSLRPEARAELLSDPRFRNLISDAIRTHLSGSASSPSRREVRAAVRSSDGASMSNPELRREQGAARVERELRRPRNGGQVEAVTSLNTAGVRLLVGSDAPGAPGAPVAHGIGTHREIELLARAGLAPTEVLAAATANAADAFRLHDRGRILPGRRADMLLVRGDPTRDLLAIRDIVRVWKGGVEHDGDPNIDHFDGLNTFSDLPRDGKCVADYWC